jgi:hypothetical protein
MLRRKILQLILASAATSTLALMGTAVRASVGASRNDSGASRNDTGASRNDSSGASRNGSGASVYCATDANGQQTCWNETSDSLSNVSDSDLDEVLRSFNQ